MSNVYAEHLQPLPVRHLDLLLDILNTCLRTSRAPTSWYHTNLYLIPKTPVYTGDLGKTRPISLIDLSRKLLMKILTLRLTSILAKHHILKGNNAGFSRGLSTYEVALCMRMLVDHSRLLKRDLEVVLTDISKAYDSVSAAALALCLRRIKCPEPFITLYLSFMSHATLHIITPYGPSAGFSPQAGLPQGDSIAPTLWNVFYDVLCALAKHDAGYVVTAADAVVDPKVYPTPAVPRTKVSYFAFADDLTIVSSTRTQTQALLTRAQEFFAITSIRLNPAKSTVLTSRPRHSFPLATTPRQHDTLSFAAFDQDPVTIADIRECTHLFRFLGTYMSLAPNGKGLIDTVLSEADGRQHRLPQGSHRKNGCVRCQCCSHAAPDPHDVCCMPICAPTGKTGPQMDGPRQAQVVPAADCTQHRGMDLLWPLENQ
jgi:hypothetical protein